MRAHTLFLAAAILVAAPLGAGAQTPASVAAPVSPDGPPAYLEAGTGMSPASNDPEVLRTTERRAVLSLARGGWLFLDRASSVRLSRGDDGDVDRLEVLAGSVLLAADGGRPVVTCENHIRLSDAGFVRFDVAAADGTNTRPCTVRVYDGTAVVTLVSTARTLRAGGMMQLDRMCGDMQPFGSFSPSQLDEFDRWARTIRPHLAR